MKKNYEVPELKVALLDRTDIIVTSDQDALPIDTGDDE